MSLVLFCMLLHSLDFFLIFLRRTNWKLEDWEEKQMSNGANWHLVPPLCTNHLQMTIALSTLDKYLIMLKDRKLKKSTTLRIYPLHTLHYFIRILHVIRNLYFILRTTDILRTTRLQLPLMLFGKKTRIQKLISFN